MNTSEFKNTYWKYYLILESNVLDVEPYVSFHPDNYNCFSNEFIKLYQTICSEIDVICKKYCKYIAGEIPIVERNLDMRDYAKYILQQHPEIINQNIHLIEQSRCEFIPWKEWHFTPAENRKEKSTKNYTPEWWKKYNAVKHRRSDEDSTGKYNFQYANLKNVLNALAALYTIEKYFYTDLAKKNVPSGKTPNIVIAPYSKLFGLFKEDDNYLTLMNLGI